MNQANAPPKSGRRFYSIVPNDEGTVDVLLNPDAHPMTTEDGATDYSIIYAPISRHGATAENP